MSARNARIAKNTLALYFRTVLTIIVSLYTSRVVLDALGASDFGLFTLVAGFVALMGFLQAAMISSTQRFLNYEKGTRDPAKLRLVFGTSLFVHICLAGCILLIGETLGLWLLNTQLNIDPARIDAANWLLQCAILSFLIQTISSPYNAAIIANERMAVFAQIALLDAALKLIVAHLLSVIGQDELKVYGVLMMLAVAAVALLHALYARHNFPECRVWPSKDKTIFREILSFSSWSMTSSFSYVLRMQGTSIILNLFFGTVVNAALGIAMQVNNAIQSLSLNLTQALNPQIVINYASGEFEEMYGLILNGCRLAFFLVLLFSLPLLLETDLVLNVWLADVPEHTATFVQLILIQLLVESFAGILSTAQGATGRVKTYHLTLSFIGLMNLPISFMLLTAGFPPYVVLAVAIVLSGVIGVVRVLFLRKSIALPMSAFLSRVVARCVAVALLAPSLPLAIRHFMQDHPLQDSALVHMGVFIASGASVLFAVALVGIAGNERRMIVYFLSNKLKALR